MAGGKVYKSHLLLRILHFSKPLARSPFDTFYSMKTFAVLAAFVATCLAQSISIVYPTLGTPVSSGDSITVEIDRVSPLCLSN